MCRLRLVDMSTSRSYYKKADKSSKSIILIDRDEVVNDSRSQNHLFALNVVFEW